MKTYTINKPQDLEKFKDEYGYKVDGSLDIKCDIDIEGRLLVFGYINAGGYIKAGGYIEAGRGIEADDGISAGLSITCKDSLKVGLKCFAGICTWKRISDEKKTITCGKFEGGTIEYGILKEIGIDNKVKITCEGKEVEISRASAEALNLI